MKLIIKNIKNIIFKDFLKNINFSIFKKLFFSVSIAYFSFYFLVNFGQISFSINLQRNGINIFSSFLFCLLSIFLNAFAWKNIVIWFGKTNIKNNLVSFYVVTNILKYVPGGIWHFVERFNYIKDISNPQLAFYSNLVEPYFMLSASFLLASVGIIFSPVYFLLVIPMFFLNRKLIYLVLLRLESLKGRVSKILNFSNSEYQLKKRICLNSFFPTKAFLLEIGFVFSKFYGFLICFNAVNSNYQYDKVFLFIIFCLSWSIGLIIPSAPSGVGVFEACFLFLIGENIPQNIIFVSLIYFRLISTSADLFLSFPFLFKKILKRL